MAHVGLYDVGSLKLEHLPVLVALVDALAGGDGRLAIPQKPSLVP